MSIATQIPKGEIWTLLGEKAMGFALWLNNTENTNSVAVRTVFESVVTIDLESPVFRSILDILLAELIITTVEVAVIDARIVELNTPPSFGSQ